MGEESMCVATGYSDQVPAQGVAGWGVRWCEGPDCPLAGPEDRAVSMGAHPTCLSVRITAKAPSLLGPSVAEGEGICVLRGCEDLRIFRTSYIYLYV